MPRHGSDSASALYSKYENALSAVKERKSSPDDTNFERDFESVLLKINWLASRNLPLRKKRE
jgi:hypothetical protein